MTREEALNRVKGYLTDIITIEGYSEVEEIVKALEQEPCEDAVSRQAVIELCEGWWLGHTKEDDFATEVRALPTVTQKPETDILDKIRAELHATAEMHEDGDYYLRDEWIDEYFDKYKEESEV